MYSDLMDVLGGASNRRGGGDDARRQTLVTFKAGKMNANLQENGKYWISPDVRKGQVMLRQEPPIGGQILTWEWMERRSKRVIDAVTIVDDSATFSRIPTTDQDAKAHVYVLQLGDNTSARHFYWLQEPKKKPSEDEEEEEEEAAAMAEDPEEVLITKINQYLAGSGSAAGGSGSGTNTNNQGSNDGQLNNDMFMQLMGRGGGSATAGTSGSSSEAAAETSSANPQVDALSSILENLGMPQAEGSSSASAAASGSAAGAVAQTPTNAASSSSSSTQRPLTLADLQGAMANLATTSPQPPGPPLQEILTPAAIQGLVQHSESRQRLLALLPPDQQTEEHLLENLQSPQVSQTLRTLTGILMPDSDTGSLDGFYSMLANFQLPNDGPVLDQANRGNPIQAFLDSVATSVKNEQEEKKEEEQEQQKEETKDEEMKDEEMKE